MPSDPLIHKGYLGELADAYVPAGTKRTDPRISPLFADLRGLPPMLIQVGSAETLLDDSVRLAGVAGAADVAVTLEIWPDMIHAWPLWNAKLEAGRQALAQAGAFFQRHLSSDSSLRRHCSASARRSSLPRSVFGSDALSDDLLRRLEGGEAVAAIAQQLAGIDRAPGRATT